MSRKPVAIGTIIIGAILLFVSLLADLLGIGQYPSAIGPVQLFGAAVGFIILIMGIILVFRKGKPKQ